MLIIILQRGTRLFCSSSFGLVHWVLYIITRGRTGLYTNSNVYFIFNAHTEWRARVSMRSPRVCARSITSAPSIYYILLYGLVTPLGQIQDGCTMIKDYWKLTNRFWELILIVNPQTMLFFPDIYLLHYCYFVLTDLCKTKVIEC